MANYRRKGNRWPKYGERDTPRRIPSPTIDYISFFLQANRESYDNRVRVGVARNQSTSRYMARMVCMAGVAAKERKVKERKVNHKKEEP